jgi:hypothetical protein
VFLQMIHFTEFVLQKKAAYKGKRLHSV